MRLVSSHSKTSFQNTERNFMSLSDRITLDILQSSLTKVSRNTAIQSFIMKVSLSEMSAILFKNLSVIVSRQLN